MKIFKKIIKGVAILIFIFALIITFLMMYGKYRPVVIKWYEEYKAERYLEMLENQKKELEDARRADTYGGKTPEETIRLLIQALEKGDVELARKYYDVESPTIRYFSDSNLNFRISNLNMLLNNGIKKCGNKGCTIEYIFVTQKDKYENILGTNKKVFIPAGSTDRMAIEFIKNPYTGLWKIF